MADPCTDTYQPNYDEHSEKKITSTNTAMAKAILRLKTLAFVPSKNMIGSIYLRTKDE